MTLLDFELHMRAVKVGRGRNMFLKDQVIDLSTDGDEWTAKIKFGLYEVIVGLEGLMLAGSSCKCDARRYTQYCEHAIAVLFAVRKQLGLKPILASVVPKIACIDYSLVNLLETFNAFEYEITDEDILTFAGKVEQMLKSVSGAFKKKDYTSVASLGFAVVTGLQSFDLLLEYSYVELEKYNQKAFAWLEKLFTLPVKEELYDLIFHDTRIAAVKSYQTVCNEGKNWMDLLLAGANNAVRKDQFIRTMNALCILVGGSESKEDQKMYVEQFLYYRDKLDAQV